MKFTNTNVTGMANAIYGARLPMCKDFKEAVSKSDSGYVGDEYDTSFVVGGNDLQLLQKLINADVKGGQPNSKFLRMIHVQVCITAPLYWWKEASTYKIGTTANSTSTMHKLASTPITMDCFEMGDFEKLTFVNSNIDILDWERICEYLELLRQKYNETKDKRYWKELIRLLPESWLQTRMFDCDYATLRNMYYWRVKIPHKLTEWKQFGEWVETLPYAKELITGE